MLGGGADEGLIESMLGETGEMMVMIDELAGWVVSLCDIRRRVKTSHRIGHSTKTIKIFAPLRP